MATLAEAVVESSWTMLDAEELSLLYGAAPMQELDIITAATVMMQELGVQVKCYLPQPRKSENHIL